jgi:hypothetical protein
MNVKNINSKEMFGPFVFNGKVMKRSICVYSVAFDFLRKGCKFKILNLSQEESSFLIGNAGKTLRYYGDRSIKFHIPQSIVNYYDKDIEVKIYTKDIKLANRLAHIKGSKRLRKSNFWFKCDSTKKFSKATQITISSRALTDYFYRNGINKAYIDQRKNYAIIKSTKFRPSKNSFISKVWINDKRVNDKLSFVIPKMCKINYICLSGFDFKLNSRVFQTKEEFELAKELIKKYNVLCISGKQTHDIKLLESDKNYVKEITAINLKNMEKGRTAHGQVFSDILKGIIFYQKKKKLNFLILNSEWREYNHFKNFANTDIAEFSRENGVNIMFTDYKDNWQQDIIKQMEPLFFL